MVATFRFHRMGRQEVAEPEQRRGSLRTPTACHPAVCLTIRLRRPSWLPTEASFTAPTRGTTTPRDTYCALARRGSSLILISSGGTILRPFVFMATPTRSSPRTITIPLDRIVTIQVYVRRTVRPLTQAIRRNSLSLRSVRTCLLSGG